MHPRAERLTTHLIGAVIAALLIIPILTVIAAIAIGRAAANAIMRTRDALGGARG